MSEALGFRVLVQWMGGSARTNASLLQGSPGDTGSGQAGRGADHSTSR